MGLGSHWRRMRRAARCRRRYGADGCPHVERHGNAPLPPATDTDWYGALHAEADGPSER